MRVCAVCSLSLLRGVCFLAADLTGQLERRRVHHKGVAQESSAEESNAGESNHKKDVS